MGVKKRDFFLIFFSKNSYQKKKRPISLWSQLFIGSRYQKKSSIFFAVQLEGYVVYAVAGGKKRKVLVEKKLQDGKFKVKWEKQEHVYKTQKEIKVTKSAHLNIRESTERFFDFEFQYL